MKNKKVSTDEVSTKHTRGKDSHPVNTKNNILLNVNQRVYKRIEKIENRELENNRTRITRE